MTTIRHFADLTGTTALIERAITFDPKLERIWSVPCEFSRNVRNSGGWGGKTIRLAEGLRNSTELPRTFLHEVAHAMEHLLYGCTGHSQNWWEAIDPPRRKALGEQVFKSRGQRRTPPSPSQRERH